MKVAKGCANFLGSSVSEAMLAVHSSLIYVSPGQNELSPKATWVIVLEKYALPSNMHCLGSIY